jgi:adenine-specific DNA-methyltransferase
MDKEIDYKEQLDGLSLDVEAVDREKLKMIFPQCFVENKLDITKLLNLCGEYITNDFEKYEFTWKGKSDCVLMAGKRSTGTLRPCREESVNWENTKNVYIEGDNLEVLKLLQTSYYRKVKIAYLDPPYNTGSDFVYADDFKDPLERYKEITSQCTKSNPESMGRFHTNWLNMMWPRLRLAANLLRDDGVIFISIDDHEVHNLRKLMDEVFGEENFIAQINWKGRGGRQDSQYYAAVHEYILCYAKQVTEFRAGEEVKVGDSYPKFDEAKQRHYKTQLARKWGSNSKRTDRPNLFYSITAPDGSDLFPMASETVDGCWRWSKQRMQQEIDDGNVEFAKSNGVWVAYERLWEPLAGEEATKKYTTWIDDLGSGSGTDVIKSLFHDKVFDYSKPIDLIKRFIQMADVADNDLVLDFFSGSATTAHATMQLNAEDGGNRRFICVQLPELCDEKSEAHKAGYANICEIGKERIRRAGQKIHDENPLIDNLDTGFRVFKLDSSNLRLWDDTPVSGENAVEEVTARLFEMLDLIKRDRSDEDIVYEVLLKLGQDLCATIIPIELSQNRTVYGVCREVEGQTVVLFVVCIAENIKVEDAEIMAEHEPGRIIFADRCFVDSTDKANVKLTLRDKGITVRVL